MLTRQCRSVLRGLKKLTNNTEANISYYYENSSFCLDDFSAEYSYEKYENEIESIISYLVNENFLEYNSNKINFHLTQKGIHSRFLCSLDLVLFFIKELALPIIVAFITTMITLYMNGQLKLK